MSDYSSVGNRPDYGAFIPAALDDYPLNANEFRVFCHISRRAGTDRGCFESIAKTASHCRMNEKTARAAIHAMQKGNLLSLEQRPGKSTIIHPNHFEAWVSPEEFISLKQEARSTTKSGTPTENTPTETGQGWGTESGRGGVPNQVGVPLPREADEGTPIEGTKSKVPNEGIPPVVPKSDNGQKQELGCPSGNELIHENGRTEKRKSSAKKKKLTAKDLEPFRICWNEHKLDCFAGCSKLSSRRVGQLNQLVKDHGDDSLPVLQDALAQAAVEGWYQGKNLAMENFLSNDKATGLAERWRSRAKDDLPPPQSNAERLFRQYMQYFEEEGMTNARCA
ncbi:MAG: hypothetical protein AAGD25_06365 [Cyanobacteria bacterium P01_F01_bin.150]